MDGDALRRLLDGFRALEAASRGKGLSDSAVEAWDRAWERVPGDLSAGAPDSWLIAEAWADAEAGRGLFGYQGLHPYFDRADWYEGQWDLRRQILESIVLVAQRVALPEAIDRRVFDRPDVLALLDRLRAPDREYPFEKLARMLALDTKPYLPERAVLDFRDDGSAVLVAQFTTEAALACSVQLADSWGAHVAGGTTTYPEADGKLVLYLHASTVAKTEGSPLWLSVGPPNTALNVSVAVFLQLRLRS